MKVVVPDQRKTPGVRSLSRDRRGNTAVEFAMIALPFFGLLIAILQITLTFFAQQVVETVAEKAVRQLVTGEAQRSGMTQAQFKDSVCSKLPSFMKCANVMVDVRTATSFAAVDTGAPVITYGSDGNPSNTWRFTPGTGGEITIARVMYVWSVQAGPLGFDISTMSGSRKLLIATSVFKTEPYA